jgi:hypothetical protein
MPRALATSSLDVLALVPVASWPSLGFSGIEPMADRDCLNHLAACLEADGELHPRERYFTAQYLRRIASNRAALKALQPRLRGRPKGRAGDIALHYVVRSKLFNAKSASRDVAAIWGVNPESVQDRGKDRDGSRRIEQARKEIEQLVKLRLAGPSRQELPDGTLSAPKFWRDEREVLRALDKDLTARAKLR